MAKSKNVTLFFLCAVLLTRCSYNKVNLPIETVQPSLVTQFAQSWIETIAFSSDGNTLAAGGERIVLWDIQSEREIRILPSNKSVSSISFSPDGKKLVSVGHSVSGEPLQLWDVASGAKVCNFRAFKEKRSNSLVDKIEDLMKNEGEFVSVAFSPDGNKIATLKNGGRVSLWDSSSGEESRPLRFSQPRQQDSSTISFSSNGKSLSAGLENRARIWEVSSGTELSTIETGEPVNLISPNSKIGASRREDGGITLWDVGSGTRFRSLSTISGSRDSLSARRFVDRTRNSMAFSPDGKLLVAAFDKELQIWQVESGLEVARLRGHTASIKSVAVSPDGRLLASAAKDGIKIWNIASQKQLLKTLVAQQPDRVRSLAFSPDSRILAVADTSVDHSIKLWDLVSGRNVRHLKGHRGIVNSVIFSKNGVLASCSSDKTIRIWDVISGRELMCFNGHTKSVNCIAFSSDGQTLVSGGGDNSIRVWSLTSHRQLRVIHGSSKRVVAISPNGMPLAKISDSAGQALFESNASFYAREMMEKLDKNNLYEISGHSDSVVSVAFANDDRKVLSTSLDGTIRIWDASGKESHVFFILNPLAWDKKLGMSNTGDTFAHAELDKIQIRNASTGKLVREIIAEARQSLIFGPRDNWILCANDTGTIEARDSQSGKIILKLGGGDLFFDFNVSIACSPDGKLLAAGDKRVTLWRLKSKQKLASMSTSGHADWIVVSPDGRFDASNLDDMSTLSWTVTSHPMRALPIEVFMRQYFEPNLLARKVNDEELSDVPSINDLNILQPDVTIESIRPYKGLSDTVEVQVGFKSISSTANSRSGVYDLRIFRDGQLVAYLPKGSSFDGRSLVDLSRGWDSKKISKSFPVKLPHNGSKEFAFTAYAFNSNKVKSRTSRATYRLKTPISKNKGRAYLIGFGVDEYHFVRDLDCAVADVRAYGETFRKALEHSGRFAERPLFLPLISAKFKNTNASRYELPATKRSLKTVVDVLAGRTPEDEKTASFLHWRGVKKARPEDFVFFAFASHGETKKNEFYILPQETVWRSSKPHLLERTAISSNELADWLVDVDAEQIIMVVDSCYSGSAVGKEFKPGPMNSRGIGQLAYYKRMCLLSASQADSAALEFGRFGHGLLTYALVNEGLKNHMADHDPVDGKVMLKEWLRFAVLHVPKLDASFSTVNGFNSVNYKVADLNLARGSREVELNLDNATTIRERKTLQLPVFWDFSTKKDFPLSDLGGNGRAK